MDLLNYKKYIKYKLKYLQLKQKKQIGGMDATNNFKRGDLVTFKKDLLKSYVKKKYPGLHKLASGNVIQNVSHNRVEVKFANDKKYLIYVVDLESASSPRITRRDPGQFKEATQLSPLKATQERVEVLRDELQKEKDIRANAQDTWTNTEMQEHAAMSPYKKKKDAEKASAAESTEKSDVEEEVAQEAAAEPLEPGDEFDTLINLTVSQEFMGQLCINWDNHIYLMISNYNSIMDKEFEDMVESISNFLKSLESGPNKYKYLHSYLYTIIYRIIDDIIRYPNSLVNFDTHLIQMEFNENGNEYQKIRYYIVKGLFGGGDIYNPSDNNTHDDLADYNFINFIFGFIDSRTDDDMVIPIEFSEEDSDNTNVLIIGLMNIVSYLYKNPDPTNIKHITKFIIGYYFCFCLKDLRYSGYTDDDIVVDINLDPFNTDHNISIPSLRYIASMINDSHHDKLFNTKDYNYIDLIEILLGIDTVEATKIFKKIFGEGLADFNTKKTSIGRAEAKDDPDAWENKPSFVGWKPYAEFNVSSKDTDLYKHMKENIYTYIKVNRLSSQPLNLMVKDQENYFSSALFDQTSTPNGGSLLASKPAITINGPIMLDPGLGYRSAILKHTFLINSNSNIVYYIDLKKYTININYRGHNSYTITFSTEQNNDLTTFNVNTRAGKLYSAAVAKHHMTGFDTIEDSEGNEFRVRDTEPWLKKQASLEESGDTDYEPKGEKENNSAKQQIMMAKAMGDGAIGITALIGLGCFRSDHYNIVNHLHTGDTAFLSIMIANAMLINNINITRKGTTINNKQYSFISSKERENNHFTNTEIKLITREHYIVEDFKESLKTLNPNIFSEENQNIIESCYGLVEVDHKNDSIYIGDIYDNVLNALQQHRIGHTHTPVRFNRDRVNEPIFHDQKSAEQRSKPSPEPFPTFGKSLKE